MEYGKYYKIPSNKLGWVLKELEKKDFKWREMAGGSPISKYYYSSLNLELNDPVLEV